jgi:hypothetical protein
MITTEIKHLRELVNLVHDLWFDVERIMFDHTTGVVSFRVERKRSDLTNEASKGIVLEVRNVKELTIYDTEKVRYYDIDQITFDPKIDTIVLTGGIPIEIVFRVSALEIHASGSPAMAKSGSDRGTRWGTPL